LLIVFMTTFSEPLTVDDVIVTSGTKAVTVVPVERHDRGTFSGSVQLVPGHNRISVTGRAYDGSRLRSTFLIDVPSR
jgi:hypothetical protein